MSETSQDKRIYIMAEEQPVKAVFKMGVPVAMGMLFMVVYNLVDTYFMPYGVECDQYSVLGEITEFRLVTNDITGEKVYILTILCNELSFGKHSYRLWNIRWSGGRGY